MPSDEKETQVLSALEVPVHEFRSALARAVEQVRGFLDAHRASPEIGNGADLGIFAAGRIDSRRFAALLTKEAPVDAAALERADQAFRVLSELASGKESLYVTRVAENARLDEAVSAALSRVGRAFGAARVVELARTGRFVEAEHAWMLDDYPFVRWTQAERRLAPPLVVHLTGQQVRPECLVRFLDGRLKLVLVVDGDTSPAPLVRLITPGVYVLQTSDRSRLNGFAAFSGPGIAALVSEGAARFVHDPSKGDTPAERLVLDFVPEEAASQTVAWLSPAQQEEELAQLRALASGAREPSADLPAPSAPAARSAPALPTAPAASDSVDKLAAWLLNQADLSNLE